MARTLIPAVVALSVLGFAFAPSAFAQDDLDAKIEKAVKEAMKGKDTDFKAYWKNGLNFKSNDGNFKVHVGGRVYLDYWFFDDDDIEAATGLSWRSGWEFRAARLAVSGSMYKYLKWKVQMDFAGAADTDREVQFKDVYMGVHGLEDCFGCLFPDITIGHFKEYFSLENLTSSRFITFMERALPVTTFAPGRNTGLGLFRDFYGERATLGLGIWAHNVDNTGDGFWFPDGRDGGYDITGRFTTLVWAPCDCNSRFLHLGVSGSYQDGFDELRYRTRPEVHLGPRIANTGSFVADSVFLYGAELAFGWDQFHVQGEFIGASVSSQVENDPSFMGWYVEASWMFLGGFRPLKRATATYDKVKPCMNWLGESCCGPGGWELAARYSFLDLEDQNIFGGEVNDITVGVNWYLNPNAVVKVNYVLANLQNGAVDETLNAFGVRFQVYF